MWDIYASAGVAICTTPAKLRKAFNLHHVDSGIIAAVNYSEAPESEASPDLFLRPYLFKKSCYRHEQEVRVIFPNEKLENYAGHKLPILASELIQEIRLSPFLPRDESRELAAVLRGFSAPFPEVNIEDQYSVFPSDVFTSTNPFQWAAEIELPDPKGIANFGTIKMPPLLSNDIRRSLCPRPEWD